MLAGAHQTEYGGCQSTQILLAAVCGDFWLYAILRLQNDDIVLHSCVARQKINLHEYPQILQLYAITNIPS